MRLVSQTFVAAVASLALVAACGSDGSEETAPSAAAEATSAAETTSTPTSAPAVASSINETAGSTARPATTPTPTPTPTSTSTSAGVADVELGQLPTEGGTSVALLRADDGGDGSGCFFLEFANGVRAGIETSLAWVTTYSGGGTGTLFAGDAQIRTDTAVTVTTTRSTPKPSGADPGYCAETTHIVFVTDLETA